MATMNWQSVLETVTIKTRDVVLDMIRTRQILRDEVIGICYTDTFTRKELLEFINAAIRSEPFEKVPAMAFQLRLLGNKKFLLNDNRGSMMSYTESIRYAPEKCEDLPLAFANRSATFFHMDNLEDCLKDIDMALKTGYPQNLCYKLYSRQGQTYFKLGKYKQAVDSFRDAISMLDHATSLTPEKKAEVARDLEKAIIRANKKVSLETHPLPFKSVSVKPIVSYGDNKNFSSTSVAVDLKHSEGKGRFVVANRDIKLGDTLFVEKPFALLIRPDQYNIHCHFCCKECVRLLPCTLCIQVTYCSETCEELSWNQYHQWECHGGLNLLKAIGIGHLSLRVLLAVGSINEFNETFEDVDKEDVDELEVFKDPDAYQAVYHLESHINELSAEGLYHYALTACLIVLYLETHTNYFEDLTISPKKAIQWGTQAKLVSLHVLRVGNILVRHIAQLMCNTLPVIKLKAAEAPEPNVLIEEEIHVGLALYPAASMLNHSCDPNIVCSFYNQHIVIRACKAIPAGSEVLRCYGPHFRRMSGEKRRKFLKEQYFFDCTCDYCLYPDVEMQLNRFYALKCSQCEGPVVEGGIDTDTTSLWICLQCKSHKNVIHVLESLRYSDELYTKANLEIESGLIKTVLSMLQKCLDLRIHCLYKQNVKIAETLELIAKTYAMMKDYTKSAQYLLQCLPVFEAHYGDASIEVAYELQKLTDILFLELQETKQGTTVFREKHQHLLSYIQKAQSIFQLYYGQTNKCLLELQQKEENIVIMQFS